MGSIIGAVGIIGTGSYLPKRAVYNSEFDKHGGEVVARIEDIGIRERRWAGPDEPLPVMMAIAAKRALKNANLEPQNIDTIYVGTNSTDPFLVPSLSARTHYLLGAPRCNALDIGSGCCSSVQGLILAQRELVYKRMSDRENQNPRNILLIAGDVLSNVTSNSSPVNRAILADGVGAVVLSDLPESDRNFGILSAAAYIEGMPHLISYTSGYGGQPPSDFEMNGREVHKFVLRSTHGMVREAFEKAGVPLSEIVNTKIVPHQVNRRTIEELSGRLADLLGVEEIKPENFYSYGATYYGNASCASCLMGIDHLNREGQLSKGDLLFVPVWGANMMSAYFLARWNREKSDSSLFDDRSEDDLAYFNEKYSAFLRDVQKIRDRRLANNNP